jgi:hypothetical protein
MGNIKYYIDVYRPSHWFKNFFMLVGSFLLFWSSDAGFSLQNIIYIVIAFAAHALQLPQITASMKSWMQNMTISSGQKQKTDTFGKDIA